MDLLKHFHVLLGVGSVVVACGGGTSTTPPASAERTSTPASEQAAEEAAAGPSVDRGSPPAPKATPADVDPCAGVECPDGYCDVKTVQCVRAPCPPVATCVAGTHPCAAMTCATNTRCESHDERGVCVPLTGTGVPCGKVTCAADQTCCNASCGTCTPPDGACTQQACE